MLINSKSYSIFMERLMSKQNPNQTIKIQDPNWLKPQFENIPDELKQLPWAVWIAEPRLDKDGKPTGKYNKAPRSPIYGMKIGANQPEQFGTFEEAKETYSYGRYTGVGVLLTGSGIIGIDIDNVAELVKTKPEVKTWLKKAIASGAYCEISPSNTGIRIFVIGNLDGHGRKASNLEIYDNKRFLTVTGNLLKLEGVSL